MQPRTIKRLGPSLLGAAAAALALAASAAAANQGDPLRLGQDNPINLTTTLSGTTAGPQLRVTNANGAYAGLKAESAGGSGSAVYALHTTSTGVGAAVLGTSSSTAASAFSIFGLLTSTTPGSLSAAVRGSNQGTNASGYGVWGSHAGSGVGVRGDSQGGDGMLATSQTGTGLGAGHYAAAGTRPAVNAFTWSRDPGASAVYAQVLPTNAGESSAAVEGKNSSTACTSCYGVRGVGQTGVYGFSTNDYGTGVLGEANARYQEGVTGSSTATDGTGVYGKALNGGSARGVYGESSTGRGVLGSTDWGTGIEGLVEEPFCAFYSCSPVTGIAVKGTAYGQFQTGVLGKNSKGPGVAGSSASGTGVAGSSTSGTGVFGSSTTGTGGSFSAPLALQAKSTTDYGFGVIGETTGGGVTYGVWGKAAHGYAGFFSGDVQVVGTLSKTAGSFRIDHPLDPAHEYLQHSFVESPDMKDVYDGVVTTDARGFATVTLPRWFQALNRTFRYQLTVMGTRGWNARVVKEIAGNRFAIQSDRPRVEVSWQVTGIRHDPYAVAHPIEVEVRKPPREQGRYVFPQGYGKPRSLSVAVRPEREPR